MKLMLSVGQSIYLEYETHAIIDVNECTRSIYRKYADYS